MENSNKKNIWILEKEWLVIGLMGLKPIVDMAYAARWMDGILLFGMILLAVRLLKKEDFEQYRQNIVPLIWFILLLISLLMSMNETYWIGWIKLASIFPVYFVALHFKEEYLDKLLWVLQISYLIVLAVNIILLITGSGFQTWAYEAQTFTGPYYFKTDLAVAMAQVLLIATMRYPMKGLQWGMGILAIIIALLTNSRIFFAIILLLVAICGVWAHKSGKKLKFGIIVAVVGLLIVLSVLLITALALIPFFKEKNFISFTIQGSLWDMMLYNLMYRNVIWRDLIIDYLQGDFWHILLGKGVLS